MNLRNRRYALPTLALAAAVLLLLGPMGVQAQDGDWEWQNPLPQGHHLYGVWGSGDIGVFAGGDRGTILHYDGERHVVYLPPVLRHPPYPGWPPQRRSGTALLPGHRPRPVARRCA